METATERSAGNGLRIVELRAENLKRLVAIEIHPTSDIIEITGRNAAGKSSVLDAIAYACGGQKLCPTEPIRNGEEKASVSVKLDNGLQVTRTWTRKGSYLTVTNADGADVRSPQKVLDELIGSVSFDPLAFTRMEPAKQRAVLLDLLGIEGELQLLSHREDDARREATQIRQEIKRLQGCIDSTPGVPESTPDEPVDVSALLSELEAIDQHNAIIKQAEDQAWQAGQVVIAQSDVVAHVEADIREIEGRLAARRADLKTATDRLADAEKHRNEANTTRARLGETRSVVIVKERIARSQAVNADVAAKQRIQQMRSELHGRESALEVAVGAVKAIESKRYETLRAAKWPVAGLSVAHGDVRYNDVPLDQCSAAEQLRVSLSIAMAANPRLRVILIRDGSLLDADNLKAIGAMAGEHGYQLWIERVAPGAAGSVLIEDGRIVEEGVH